MSSARQTETALLRLNPWAQAPWYPGTHLEASRPRRPPRVGGKRKRGARLATAQPFTASRNGPGQQRAEAGMQVLLPALGETPKTGAKSRETEQHSPRLGSPSSVLWPQPDVVPSPLPTHHPGSPDPTSSLLLDLMLHSLQPQTGIRYLQSGSTTLQVVLHGEVPGVPPPLAVERLPGGRAPLGTQGLGAKVRRRDSNPHTPTHFPSPGRKCVIWCSWNRTSPRPRRRRRSSAPGDSRDPGGAKWGVAEGVLGNVVRQLRNGCKNRGENNFTRLLV